MSKIFLSYRRDDAAGYAGRICDRLSASFGDASVFMDVQDLRAGEDFHHAIAETVGQCDVLVAVIGPRWLSTLEARAHEPDDFVRHEITAALARGVRVIPVLVGGAQVPEESRLPADLAELSRRQMIEISDARFEYDTSRLISAIREVVKDGAGGASQAGRRFAGLTAGSLYVRAAIALLVVLAVFLGIRQLSKSSGAAAGDLSGEWVAAMEKSGQRPYEIRLNLRQAGERLDGLVLYPTGQAAIQEGNVQGGRITFFTRHQPDFSSQPATIRFQGVVSEGKIHLTTTDDFGVAEGWASRLGSEAK